MERGWTFNEFDGKAVKQFSRFIPEKIFDFHAHMYCVPDLNLQAPSIWSGGPSEVFIDVWKKYLIRFLTI